MKSHMKCKVVNQMEAGVAEGFIARVTNATLVDQKRVWQLYPFKVGYGVQGRSAPGWLAKDPTMGCWGRERLPRSHASSIWIMCRTEPATAAVQTVQITWANGEGSPRTPCTAVGGSMFVRHHEQMFSGLTHAKVANAFKDCQVRRAHAQHQNLKRPRLASSAWRTCRHGPWRGLPTNCWASARPSRRCSSRHGMPSHVAIQPFVAARVLRPWLAPSRGSPWKPWPTSYGAKSTLTRLGEPWMHAAIHL